MHAGRHAARRAPAACPDRTHRLNELPCRQAGRPTDEPQLAELVVQLLQRTRCANCLVWAKSDPLVRAVKHLLPAQRCGYVLMEPTPEARRMGLDRPLRMLDSEVGPHRLFAG